MLFEPLIVRRSAWRDDAHALPMTDEPVTRNTESHVAHSSMPPRVNVGLCGLVMLMMGQIPPKCVDHPGKQCPFQSFSNSSHHDSVHPVALLRSTYHIFTYEPRRLAWRWLPRVIVQPVWLESTPRPATYLHDRGIRINAGQRGGINGRA